MKADKLDKKFLITLFFLILFISSISGCIDKDNNLEKNVRIEGKEKVFSSINNAIDESIEGDVIRVGKGIYKENIIIYKTLSLIGEDKENTIIDAQGTGDGIHIIADRVKIIGFTIKNGGNTSYPTYDSAIDIRSNGNHISNNNIRNNKKYGIYVEKGSNNTFIENLVTNNMFGIYLNGYYSIKINQTNISNNIISNNFEKGVYLSYNYNSTISDNSFYENEYGIHMKQSDGNIVVNNLFDKNKYGLFFCCGAESNIIFRNILVNNTEYNAKSNTKNQFDYSGVGNYWDDYNGSDENNDNIGDNPYSVFHNENIEIQNLDRYPIIAEFR